jgi:hypothetical protein
MTYKNGNIKMYLDWILEFKTVMNWFLPNSSDLTSIWKERSSYWPMDGVISEVRIYNRELSPQEAKYMSNNSIIN